MKYSLFIILMLLPITLLFSATKADEIVGIWLNPDGNRKMEIYKEGDKYFGKIVWLKDSEEKAKVGDIVLKSFTFNGEEWEGEVHIAQKNRDLSGTIEMKDSNTISISASVGFISRSKEWKRVEN